MKFTVFIIKKASLERLQPSALYCAATAPAVFSTLSPGISSVFFLELSGNL